MPEKYESYGCSAYRPTCCSAPRSTRAMNGSPEICSENRVHRAHRTQRSRSSSTCAEIGTGFGNVRLTPSYRDSPRPFDIAWFCRGHSPPLSQIGQSSGWLMSSSSSIPPCALAATGLDSWVLIFIPGIASSVQDACGLGMPRPLPMSGTSTMHWRQAPTGSSSGWSQNRGIAMPRRSAARITSVPLGTLTSMPSIVRVIASTACSTLVSFVVTVMRELPWSQERRSVRSARTAAGPRRASCSRPRTRCGSASPRW